MGGFILCAAQKMFPRTADEDRWRYANGCPTTLNPPNWGLVGFLVSELTVIQLGQQTVAVVRRIFVPGNGILGPIFVPLPPKVVARIIFEVELHIFPAVTAKQLNVVRRISGQGQCFGLFP